VRRDGYPSGEDQPAPHVSRGIDSQLGGCAVRRLGRGMLAEYIASARTGIAVMKHSAIRRHQTWRLRPVRS